MNDYKTYPLEAESVKPELKLCPFCGEQHSVEAAVDYHWGPHYGIHCANRALLMAFDTEQCERMIAFWNARAIEDALRAENERLRAELETATRPIPFAERAPETGGWYLMWPRREGQQYAYGWFKVFYPSLLVYAPFSFDACRAEIMQNDSHWLPLPAQPEEHDHD